VCQDGGAIPGQEWRAGSHCGVLLLVFIIIIVVPRAYTIQAGRHGTDTCRVNLGLTLTLTQSCVRLVVRRRLHDTGHVVRVRGTYVTCRHLVCASSLAERGLTPSGKAHQPAPI